MGRLGRDSGGPVMGIDDVTRGGLSWGIAAVLLGLAGAAAAQTAPAPPAPEAPKPTTDKNTTGAATPQSALARPAAKSNAVTPAELAYLNAEAQFRAHNYYPAYLALLPIAHGGDPRAEFL